MSMWHGGDWMKNEIVACLKNSYICQTVKNLYPAVDLSRDCCFVVDSSIIKKFADDTQSELCFIPRKYAEPESFSKFRQVIPYSILIDENWNVLCYTRSKTEGDARLAGGKSIGFGGHLTISDVVSPITYSFAHIFCYGMNREIYEEISEEFFGENDLKCFPELLMIRSWLTPVDKVHLGICPIFSIGKFPEEIKHSSEIFSIEIVTLEDLETFDTLESWSKILLPHLKTMRNNKNEREPNENCGDKVSA